MTVGTKTKIFITYMFCFRTKKGTKTKTKNTRVYIDDLPI